MKKPRTSDELTEYLLVKVIGSKRRENLETAVKRVVGERDEALRRKALAMIDSDQDARKARRASFKRDKATERLRVVENERDEALKALNEARLERDKAMRERDHAVLASAQYERQDAMDQRSENARARQERNERRPWLRSYLSPCDGSLDEVLWEIAIGC